MKRKEKISSRVLCCFSISILFWLIEGVSININWEEAFKSSSVLVINFSELSKRRDIQSTPTLFKLSFLIWRICCRDNSVLSIIEELYTSVSVWNIIEESSRNDFKQNKMQSKLTAYQYFLERAVEVVVVFEERRQQYR